MGSGAFVNTPDWQNVTPSSYGVYSLIDYAKSMADTFLAELSTSLEDLQGLVGTYNPDKIDIDTDVPQATGPTFPTPPQFADLVLDDSWPANWPFPPILTDYGNLDFEFIAPLPPAEIDGNFGYIPSEYTSEMWDALFTKVYNWIVEGGTGLTPAVHSSIVQREQEARRINEDREWNNAINAVGENGLNLPSGQAGAILSEFQREKGKRDATALLEIMIKDFDLATENTRFAITSGLTMEGMLRQAFENLENRGFEIAKAAKDFLIRVYEANVKMYLAKWEGIKLAMEALTAKIHAITELNTGKIEIYSKQVDATAKQIDGITQKNAALIADRQGRWSIYGTEVGAIATQWEIAIKNAGLDLEGIRLQVQILLEEAGLDQKAYDAAASLAERVSSAIAQFQAQVAASAIGMMHTSVSSGWSAGESISETISHGESLGESHGYSHDS